jgi:TatA/E family protein of Tat protein translocase
MRFFNIGIREVILLLVIMLILFGPNKMKENARSAAKAIRSFARSDTWRSFLGMVDDVNTVKGELYRESGLKEMEDSLREVKGDLRKKDTELHKSLRDENKHE